MDAEDTALTQALGPLRGKLNAYIATRRRELNSQTIHDINEIIYDEAVRVKQRTGMKLPPIAAIVLPSFGWIHLCRADMENEGVDQMIKNLIMEHRTRINGRELALAVRNAFPNYRPNKPMLIHA